MHLNNKWKVIFFTLFLSVFLASCNNIKIGYNYGHWFLRHSVYKYTNLNSSQVRLLEQQFQSFLDYNKKYDIPNYIALLRHIKRLSSHKEATEQALEEITLDAQTLTYAAFESFIDHAVPVIQTLSPKQIQEIRESISDKFDERIEEYEDKTLEERQDKRFNQLLDRFATYMGDLNEEQQKLLRDRVNLMHFVTVEQEKERKQFSLEWLDKLEKAQKDKQELTSLLKSRLFSVAITEYNRRWIHFYLALQKTATQKQIDGFQKKLQNIIDPLQDLHQEAIKKI